MLKYQQFTEGDRKRQLSLVAKKGEENTKGKTTREKLDNYSWLSRVEVSDFLGDKK